MPKAIGLLERGADTGSGEAMQSRYLNIRDYNESARWICKAIAVGYERARESLASVEKRLGSVSGEAGVSRATAPIPPEVKAIGMEALKLVLDQMQKRRKAKEQGGE